MKTDASQAMYERAVQSVPAGTHSNTRARSPYPLYFNRADGPFVWDLDGNRYTDLNMGNGAVMLGHKYPAVQQAVTATLASGLTTGLETEASIRAAELLLAMVPTAEAVRFTNTGTEAMLHVLQIARAVTGRQRIAKVEGAYHGWADAVYVSTWPNLDVAGPDDAPVPLPGTGGLRTSAVEETVVIPFNDADAAERILRANGKELAAILVEPAMIDVGFIPPRPGYLETLRRLADKTGALLVFDELLTGFRLARGGAQERYGVRPDLSTFGKALGNGYPVAAVAGRRQYLEVSVPGAGNTAWVGTFNGHAMCMAAAEASLTALSDGSVTTELESRTQDLIAGFQSAVARLGVPAQMQGAGGHIHWYFSGQPVRNYRQAARGNKARYAVFAAALTDAGFMVSPNYLMHHAISLAHGPAEQESLARAMAAGLAAAARLPE